MECIAMIDSPKHVLNDWLRFLAPLARQKSATDEEAALNAWFRIFVAPRALLSAPPKEQIATSEGLQLGNALRTKTVKVGL
ncbi:MAG TPA: hypothetical protein VFD70_04710 [Anaerolineae bacterium]|nr:hypothetical protein [Anaerolineae bacterium]